MKVITIVAAIAATSLLAGCATRASGVAPMAISASDYAGLTCSDARAKLELARQKENALTRKQNNAATADAAGVFLLFLPLGSVFGGDVQGELAQAKGEALALQRHIDSACSAGK